MTGCEGVRDYLVEYEHLKPQDRLEADAHVRECRSCREYLAILHDIDVALVAHSASIRLNPERISAIRLGIAATRQVRPASARSEWLDLVAACAVAACAFALAWSTGLFGVVMSVLASLLR